MAKGSKNEAFKLISSIDNSIKNLYFQGNINFIFLNYLALWKEIQSVILLQIPLK